MGRLGRTAYKYSIVRLWSWALVATARDTADSAAVVTCLFVYPLRTDIWSHADNDNNSPAQLRVHFLVVLRTPVRIPAKGYEALGLSTGGCTFELPQFG